MREQSGCPVGAGGLIKPCETLTPLHKVLRTVAHVDRKLDKGEWVGVHNRHMLFRHRPWKGDGRLLIYQGWCGALSWARGAGPALRPSVEQSSAGGPGNTSMLHITYI